MRITTVPAVKSMFFHHLLSTSTLHAYILFSCPPACKEGCTSGPEEPRWNRSSQPEGWVKSPPAPGHCVLEQASFQLPHHTDEPFCPTQACTRSQKNTLSPAKHSPFLPHLTPSHGISFISHHPSSTLKLLRLCEQPSWSPPR